MAFVFKCFIGAAAYDGEDQAKTAFGKVNPFRYGVLPVLVVIQNDSGKAIRTDQVKVEFVGPDSRRIESTPAADVRFLSGPRKPTVAIGPTGPKVTKTKNPLNDWTIEARAIAAKKIPARESASGFFYFQTGLFHPGSTLYVTGLSEADTGKDLFYFEIPLKR